MRRSPRRRRIRVGDTPLCFCVKRLSEYRDLMSGHCRRQMKFYERLGWELWRGRLGIRTLQGIESTPEDEEVMIMRLGKTPELDLKAFLTAEWRKGELW